MSLIMSQFPNTLLAASFSGTREHYKPCSPHVSSSRRSLLLTFPFFSLRRIRGRMVQELFSVAESNVSATLLHCEGLPVGFAQDLNVSVRH